MLSGEWRCSWSSAHRRAPTTSEWSTIKLPSKVRLVLETWRYSYFRTPEELQFTDHILTRLKWLILLIYSCKAKQIFQTKLYQCVIWFSLQVFGQDLTDAMISQGTLITMHHGGLVRLYSWPQILQQVSVLRPQHIEAKTKWPSFRRRHFQVHFIDQKLFNFT